MASHPVSNPATEKQIEFIKSLALTRDLAPDYREMIDQLIPMLEDQQIPRPVASRVIDKMKTFPNLPKEDVRVTDEMEMPNAGRYAIEHGGQMRFFKVDRPTQGKWAGFTFLSEQAGDEEFPVRGPRRKAILQALVNDSQAMARYGQEIGVCGACGRTLTDELSRELGLGPVCRA